MSTNGKPYAIGDGVLRHTIVAAAASAGVGLGTLTVLAANRDPYRLDTPSGHTIGQWGGDQVTRFVRAGETVHLRGLHYRLVSAPRPVLKPDGKPYRNTDDDWVWLQEKAAKAARWLGYLPFERIRDERNAAPEIYVPELRVSFAGATPVVSAFVHGRVELPEREEAAPSLLLSGFRAPDQIYRIALIAEKTSVGDVLRPLAREIGAELILPTGEITDTLIFEMATRANDDGRPFVVLYFSDFDPAGHQMPISVGRKLQALHELHFPNLNACVIPAALTLDQVTTLGLPSTPLKETERRADRWREVMGREQTEIDALAALNPAALVAIAEEAVAPFFDATLSVRHNEREQVWRYAAAQWLAAWSGLDALNARIAGAWENLSAAHETYEATRQEAAAELGRAYIASETKPRRPEAVAIEITAELPDPLFSTEDDYSTASRKLIAHKQLVGLDRDAQS
jgi:hypothetical protein